jgi:gamma-glutamyltranspeptidase/glutathione hydrolase
MGSGLHHRTFQGLINFMRFGMSVDEAVDAPDFYLPGADPATGRLTNRVPGGRFPLEILEGTGYAFEEIFADRARFAGEGVWIGISRDPATGALRAASNNRNNGAALAYY